MLKDLTGLGKARRALHEKEPPGAGASPTLHGKKIPISLGDSVSQDGLSSLSSPAWSGHSHQTKPELYRGSEVQRYEPASGTAVLCLVLPPGKSTPAIPSVLLCVPKIGFQEELLYEFPGLKCPGSSFLPFSKMDVIATFLQLPGSSPDLRNLSTVRVASQRHLPHSQHIWMHTISTYGLAGVEISQKTPNSICLHYRQSLSSRHEISGRSCC